MAATAKRSVTITYSGDVGGTQEIEATDNTDSPASVTLHDLSSGANTITPPTGAVCATIVPPSENTTSITLKGVTGDTGVRIHNTDPTSLALNSASSFVLTAGAALAGVRIFWS